MYGENRELCIAGTDLMHKIVGFCSNAPVDNWQSLILTTKSHVITNRQPWAGTPGQARPAGLKLRPGSARTLWWAWAGPDLDP